MHFRPWKWIILYIIIIMVDKMQKINMIHFFVVFCLFGEKCSPETAHALKDVFALDPPDSLNLSNTH